MQNLTIALEEEIGNPHVFVGRDEDLTYLLNWAQRTKQKASQSTAILSRRKRGKTALVQRFYNLLYTLADPMLIPTYLSAPEVKTNQLEFAQSYYLSVLTQYFAFVNRQPELVSTTYSWDDVADMAKTNDFLRKDFQSMEKWISERSSSNAWKHAQELGHRISARFDVRVIEIIDEFQYFQNHIYLDGQLDHPIDLATSYSKRAESKVSPQLVTGSRVGWLTTIIRRMVGRYDEHYLGPFTDAEALEAVYNYSKLEGEPINDETAPYIVTVCFNDPYYIAQIFRSRFKAKDLTTQEGVAQTLEFETDSQTGRIAKMWLEYIWDVFDRINEVNTKKIVLYLAGIKEGEKSRAEIQQDLELGLSDPELEERLHKLMKADIIRLGESNFHYQGLGDPIFAQVFRKLYGPEIENIDPQMIRSQFIEQIKQLRGELSYYKGMLMEYRVRDRIEVRLKEGRGLEGIVYNPPSNPKTLHFRSFKKDRIYLLQDASIEMDLYGRNQDDHGIDLCVEVKDWKDKLPHAAIEAFVSKKARLEQYLNRPAIFVFYASSGFTLAQLQRLAENGIYTSDAEMLNL